MLLPVLTPSFYATCGRSTPTFAHVHPALGADGTFSLRLNSPTADPDNQDAATAVPLPWTYFLFGQVLLNGQTALSEARAVLTASGTAPNAPVTPDPAGTDGRVVKYFRADGTPGTFGDEYQVTLTDSQPSGMINLDFHITEKMAMGGGEPMYMPVTDLQPWLGMTGHAILISAAGDTADQKVFRPIHAGMGDGASMAGMPPMPGGSTGPDLMFMLMRAGMVPHGVYKIWCQTRRDDRVYAFTFVVSL